MVITKCPFLPSSLVKRCCGSILSDRFVLSEQIPINQRPCAQPRLAERTQPLHDPHITSFRTTVPWVQAVFERHFLAPKQFLDAFIDLINVEKDVCTPRIADYEAETAL
jgi:hypothetical protein